MIEIVLHLRSFLRYKLGKSEAVIKLEERSTVKDAVLKFATENGQEIMNYIFDRKTGKPTALFVVNKCQVPIDYVLKEKDELTILPPIAGG